MQKPSLKDLPPEEILRLYREGDPDAFREFYRRTNKLVLNYLKRGLLNLADAEDVLQETYFRAHRYISTYRVEKNAVTWLIAIARNAMIDRIKARGGQKATGGLPIDQVPSSSRTDEQLLFQDLLKQVCIGLNESEILLLRDRILGEESFGELSEKHGWTEVNARKKVSRLLRRLRGG